MRRLIAAAALVGVACRVRQYAANTSLWHDESFVALNVIEIPLRGLLGPLGWHEPSPPGFLALEKLMVAIFGPSEYALRAIPMLAGIAALLAFAALARRLCTSDAAALLAVLFCALSPKLIAPANEVKHFSCDLLIAVALSGLTWRALRDPAPPPRLLALWAATGALGMWFSYAALFGVVGSAALLAVAAVRGWPPPARRAYLRATPLLLASAAALSVPVLAQRSAAVVAFWADDFPDLGRPLFTAVWLVRAAIGLFDYCWQPFGAVLLLAAALAARAWWRAARADLILLWLPVAVSLLAAFGRWWPFGGNQHMLFAAPAVLILAAEGVELLRRRLAARAPGVATAALAVLLAPALAGALYHLAVPRQRHELRPVIEYVLRHERPGDALAVFDPATFEFYSGRDVRGAPPPFSADQRVWVVTPRSKRGELHADVERIVAELQRTRPRVAGLETYGAAAYLFDPAGVSR